MKPGHRDPIVVDVALPGFTLERGATLEACNSRVWLHGPQSPFLKAAAAAPQGQPHRSAARAETTKAALKSDAPVVLVIHALTGDMVVGGEHGWWAPVVGTGKPLDPDRFQLICVNNLGSCYGSAGPTEPSFPRRSADQHAAPYDGPGALAQCPDDAPATITTWDQAHFIIATLDALGISSLHAIVGGSIGGMIALCIAALRPDLAERLVPIAATDAASSWIIGWNHVGRQAILTDPTWPIARNGLRIARQIAQLTYRAEAGLEAKQGRRIAVAPRAKNEPRSTGRTSDVSGSGGSGESASEWHGGGPYRVQTYLKHQGDRFIARFTAPAYICQLDAMDHHDLNRRPPACTLPAHARDTEWTGLRRIKSDVFAISIDTDMLYFPEHTTRIVEALRGFGGSVSHTQLRSQHGHDAFLIEWDQLTLLLAEALG